jgi:hypothetical protein
MACKSLGIRVCGFQLQKILVIFNFFLKFCHKVYASQEVNIPKLSNTISVNIRYPIRLTNKLCLLARGGEAVGVLIDCVSDTDGC